MLSFRNGFLWGVSTSAHQFEGGNTHNQWTAWERNGNIRSGDSCRDACGWWQSSARDIELCRDLGLNAIRISVDWGRIEPLECAWDSMAIHRYRSLLKEIHAAGMRPFVTLHHFTHPMWFEDRGAFLSPRSLEHFASYAERIVSEIGDLCSDFVTFNEPNVYAAFGYIFGNFPPGHRYCLRHCAQVMLNLHRAHASAYERIHAVHRDAQVGIATHWVDFHPATNSATDRMLAFVYDAAFNRSTGQLLRCGSLPFPLSSITSEAPEIMQKVDFLGLNVYNRLHVRSPWDEGSRKTGGLFVPEAAPQGDRGVDLPYGEAYPDAVTNAAKEHAALGVPMYIMENGVPDRADRIRPWVLTQSVRRTWEAIRDGLDIRGYFHWSIVDNFEWCEGWTLRFGLYEIDPRTQERSGRASAELYAQMVQQNGLTDEQLSRFSDPPVLSGREMNGVRR